jgi:hypothetical protein
LAVISGGILYPVVWKALGVSAMVPGFADMEALLAAGEAWAAGYDPYHAPNLFDTYHRPHIYGPGWLFTGAAGFTVAHIAEFGVLTLFGFLGSLAYWYRPDSGRSTIGVLAALLSPSILLGLERANNDLLMVALISFAAVISRYPGRLPVFGVILLLASAAWLKIYPLVAVLALFTVPGGFRLAMERLILWGLLSVTGFALYALDYLRLLRNVPVEHTIFSYDLRYALTICVGGIPELRVWTWMGTLLAALLFVKINRSHSFDYWKAFPLTGSWAFLTVSAASIWVGCLLANPSYPYRAVWLLPVLAWAASPGMGRPTSSGSLCRWLLLFLWLWWLQWQCQYTLIDLRHFEYLPVWAAVLGLTQAGVLLTTGLVAWMLAGWVWRRFRSLVAAPPSVPSIGGF